MLPVLDVSPDDGDVEPAELVELVELPDPPVVEVEPPEVYCTPERPRRQATAA